MSSTQAAVIERLLDARTDAGIWEGELSSSALSTATAVIALALRARAHPEAELEPLVQGGLDWLARHQNADGGWGDTIDSPSNVSTTTLGWVALGIEGVAASGGQDAALERAEACLRSSVGELTPERIAHAIGGVYGEDETFAAPILMACAVGGRFGVGRDAWRVVAPLPFELAALPRALFRWLGLPMVSYALPALIAVGQVIHHHRAPAGPLARTARGFARSRTLRVLTAIQPTTGGFLEATPLTSFVVMSLVACGHTRHPVVEKGLQFLSASVRADGSWPIDTNLSTWVTTLAVNALAGGGRLEELLSQGERAAIGNWLAAQQYMREHAYTGAPPGGWAWTDLAGGVPDADDTAGALLALRELRSECVDPRADPVAGLRWLANVQNRDGGIPTFCRGWGKLPFDRSCPDLAAHALRAWHAWGAADPLGRFERARERAARHLADTQRADGAWVPLWFGNQHEPAQENPLYGTARVVRAFGASTGERWVRAIGRGVDWLRAAQGVDGGWGGARGLPPTIEETALAVEALADGALCERHGSAVSDAVTRGVAWLARRTDGGTRFEPSPIGLYFAKLWYSERLYPLVFTAAALERARALGEPYAAGFQSRRAAP